MAKKTVKVSYETDRFTEIELYAKRKDLSVSALLKFALRQYMERFPIKNHGVGGKDAKAVQLEASERGL